MKVVILSEINWSFLKQRHHFIAEDFANQYDVVFVERIASRDLSSKNLRLFLLNKLRQSRKRRLLPLSDTNIKFVKSLYIPSDSFAAKTFNRIWYKLFLKRYVNDAFVYSFTPMIDLLDGHRCLCFDIIHNWWEMSWNQDVIAKRLNLYLEKSNVVITDSLPIYDRLHKRSLSVAPVLLLPGLSKNWLEFFQKEEHARNVKIASNKLVFFGNLRSNSDLTLVSRLSEICTIDLYGVVQDDCKSAVQNCNLKGEFSQDQLMSKLMGYDAVILPYADDAFSKYISPAKYFECLALRIPIISNSKLDHLPFWDDVAVQFDENHTVTDLRRNLEETDRLIESNWSAIYKSLASNVWEVKIQEHNRALLVEHT